MSMCEEYRVAGQPFDGSLGGKVAGPWPRYNRAGCYVESESRSPGHDRFEWTEVSCPIEVIEVKQKLLSAGVGPSDLKIRLT